LVSFEGYAEGDKLVDSLLTIRGSMNLSIIGALHAELCLPDRPGGACDPIEALGQRHRPISTPLPQTLSSGLASFHSPFQMLIPPVPIHMPGGRDSLPMASKS
jgi:hypothetical protein